MEKVIDLSIPHVGQQIFAHLRAEQLIENMKVSRTWKVLAQNALIQKFKGNFSSACTRGLPEIVQRILETSNEVENVINCSEGFIEVTKKLLMKANINAVSFVELTDDNQSLADVVEILLKYSLDHGVGNVKLSTLCSFCTLEPNLLRSTLFTKITVTGSIATFAET